MCTPLHAAVNNQHTETVRILLEAEAAVNYPDWWYNYPLHIASRNGDREIVELLVAAGTDLDQDSQIRGEFTPVYEAAKDGHSDIVRLLHSAGANLSLTDSAPLNSALHIASVRGHIKTVETLLELGVDVNLIMRYWNGPTGQTALYEVLVSGFNGSTTSNIETVRFLVDHGALLNMTTEYGQGLIFQVIINTGNLDFVKFIVETGEIDINKDSNDAEPRRNFFWYSPLTFAVRKGELQIVKYLVSVGADVNHDSYPLKIAMEKWPKNTKCDNKMLGIVEALLLHGAVDQTPDSRKNLLSFAAQTGCLTLVKLFVEYGADVRNNNALLYAETLPIAKYLVENGADINQTAGDGKNAVYDAAVRDKAEILKYFVESGAEINLKKQSVLFAAAENWRYGEFGITLETVKTVLSHGGEIQFGSKNGERILSDQQMAHYFSNMEIIKVLLEYEAVDVDVRTSEGRTPLMFAATLDLAIVKYLVSVGADVDAVDQDGETVIHRLIRNPSDSRAWARDWEFPKILDYLVNIAKAPLNTPNKLGVFPVQLAINRNPHYVQQLITLGVWVNITTENGDNLLHLAAAKYDLEAMKTFIENGVDVNSRNMKGETPLFHVFGSVERVKLLVDAGADMNITNNEGASVVFLAGELVLFDSNGWDAVKYLVESGAALVLNTTEGPRSILYELAATKVRHNCYVCLEDLLKTLVAQGADIDYLGPSGLTALHQVVLQLSSTEKVSTLLNVGADIDAISKEGRTPLIYAVMEQNPWFVQFLIREGADVNIKDFGNKNAFSYAIASHNEIVQVLSTKQNKKYGEY
eukprot:GFUD01035000.1.p1 GENE.GFUD01035000.1~~GFUD01035000.1.p1  ORF type:complete len:809 (+),score=203.98 GFUD01035000.1:476-2902(+)